MIEKIITEITRETPSSNLHFVNKLLIQLWDIEYVNKHYLNGIYQYSSYTTKEEWRPVNGQ